MSPLLIETIRVEGGSIRNLDGHLRRMRRSGRELFGAGGDGAARELGGAFELVKANMGSELARGRWKLRIVYGRALCRCEALRYQRPRFESVALVDGGGLNYGHKFADRGGIDVLSRRARELGGDTALIVVDGCVTDFSYANVAFYDGRLWWTPRRPLLPGTARESLIMEGRLKSVDITVADMAGFVLCSPVNAMLDLGELSMPAGRIIGDGGAD